MDNEEDKGRQIERQDREERGKEGEGLSERVRKSVGMR